MNTQAHAKAPLVSVVIASYNSASTLAETLDSVLAQTYPRVEIVVVDDGSTDRTPELLAEYGASVRAVRKPNGGLASARNAGCEAAHGDFIALLDADDLCAPERISAQVSFMLSFPDILLCSSEFSSFDASGELAARDAANYYSSLGSARGGLEGIYGPSHQLTIDGFGAPRSDDAMTCRVFAGTAYPAIAYGSFIHPPTVMFRRSAWERCGRFDESIRNGCDWEWMTRVCRAGRVGYIDQPLLHYRRSANQLSGRNHKLQVYLDILGNLERFVRDDPSLAGERMQRCIGEARLNVAEAQTSTHRLRALAAMFSAATARGVDRRWLKLFAKAILPLTAQRAILAVAAIFTVSESGG